MPEKKYAYKVKPGHRWGPFFEYGPGMTVELTQDEAEGFRDSLELVRTEVEDVMPEGYVPPTDEQYLATLTAAQLKHLPEWSEVEPPRPTSKEKIVEAILEVRRAKAKAA